MMTWPNDLWHDIGEKIDFVFYVARFDLLTTNQCKKLVGSKYSAERQMPR